MPLILVNFKTYESAIGTRAVELAKIHECIALETGASIAIAVGALDITAVAAAVDIPVFAQHVDMAGLGSYTGQLSPIAVRAAGAAGTLLNHSEHRMPERVAAAHAAAKAAGLITVTCVENEAEAAQFAELQPDFIAVEPPELIGGDISITTADPDIISQANELIGGTALLVGAGVKTGADVHTAIQLGAAGVLLASGITQAADPAAVLRDLAGGLSNL